jgi:hypothetical protein
VKAVADRCIAFIPDPDAPNPGNPIHSTAGAQARGFKAALVGGATVYGWAVGAIIDSLGVDWLDGGWAELAFRRPVYPGDEVSIALAGDGTLQITVADEICVEGHIGTGRAHWYTELARPRDLEPGPPAQPAPQLTPQSVPVGRDLRARSVSIDQKAAEAFCRDQLHESSPLFYGADARLHPAWLASQPIYLLHHTFRYGPAIHTASRIQHLGRTRVDQTVTVAGRCVDAFVRNGNHYIVNDALLLNARGEAITHIRHTAIYQLRSQ